MYNTFYEKMKPLLKRIYASTNEIEKAFNKIRRELENFGLLYKDSRLDEVDCYPDGIPSALVGVMGFYDFEDMNIHIPPLYPAGLFPWWFENRELLDVLRHEFGHALADRYKRFFRGGIFKTAFGASYGEKNVFDGGVWTDGYVTAYASTMTREDFAETFMLYMKHRGKLPARYHGKRMIEKKWDAVKQIVHGCASHGKWENN